MTTIEILLSIAIILLLILFLIKREKVNQLIEENALTINLFEHKQTDMLREHSNKEKTLNLLVTSQEERIKDLNQRFLYAIYALKYLNKNWNTALRVYNPEEGLPALRLSSNLTKDGYLVSPYNKNTKDIDSTDFLIAAELESYKLSILVENLTDRFTPINLFRSEKTILELTNLL